MIESGQHSPQELNILIVDDSELFCARLGDLLKTLAGVTICGLAHSAHAAIEFIETHILDVLILDIHMAGGSGFKVLRKVKFDHPNMVVIVLTNHPFPQYRKKYLGAGADYFMDKSSDFPMLVDLIRSLSAKCAVHV
jgi:DNA-binding NarL/FixJ family response regulator